MAGATCASFAPPFAHEQQHGTKAERDTSLRIQAYARTDTHAHTHTHTDTHTSLDNRSHMAAQRARGWPLSRHNTLPPLLSTTRPIQFSAQLSHKYFLRTFIPATTMIHTKITMMHIKITMIHTKITMVHTKITMVHTKITMYTPKSFMQAAMQKND